MKKIILSIFLISIFCSVAVSSLQAQEDIKGAIVKIYVVSRSYDYYSPWQMKEKENRGGSGCIIEGNRILTSAHVISDNIFIEVKRAGESKKYIAEVEAVDHECDLAILKVADESFFVGSSQLEINGLIEVGEKVAVYGFPKGGDELCVTEGIVSRVEHSYYTHSMAYLLTCQIDAAINNGNSGGPVIKNGEVVGVAFQAAEGENIGYMVPADVIKHFLKELKDNDYKGIPGLGVSYQLMENHDLREKYNMKDEQSGVLVKAVYPDSPAQGIIESGDIILAIGDKTIANDGTIVFRNNERTNFMYVIQNKYKGDILSLKIIRNGKIEDVSIRIKLPESAFRFVPFQQYDVAPTYYITGGLVFEPVVLNYLRKWDYEDIPSYFVDYFTNGEQKSDRKEVVALVQVLADEVNVGYQDFEECVIKSVNSKKISTIEDLVKAVEENKGEYHTFVNEWGDQIVMKRSKVEERNNIILDKYKINSDRSNDLKGI